MSGDLSADHAALLEASAVNDDVAKVRGYVTVTVKADLERHGFAVSQRSVPALLIPMWGVAKEIVGYQIRPDQPRVRDGRIAKYETPHKMKMRIDVHPSMVEHLGNPASPLIVTEGIRKGDAAVSVLGVPAVSLLGVWNFRGRNDDGGRTLLADWEYVALDGRTVLVAYDSDVMLNPDVHDALERLGAILTNRKAHVRFVYLPAGPAGVKVGLDDWLAAGPRTLADLQALAEPKTRRPEPPPAPPPPRWKPPARQTLADVVAAQRRFMLIEDPTPLYAVLGTYAAHLLPGDPVWLGVIGGTGWGKTEVVLAPRDMPDIAEAAHITGPAALLSATASNEWSADATGGLLLELGDNGMLILKDFTSILSMKHESRAELLGAFRELHDGQWDRLVGAEGGRRLTWQGRIGMVFACTEALDEAYAVMATLGERFILVRVPPGDEGDIADASLDTVGGEGDLRHAFHTAAAGLLGHLDPAKAPPVPPAMRALVTELAVIVVRARSAVSRDRNNREIEMVYTAEAPTRFTKALYRLAQGLLLIGLDETETTAVVVKVALDSITPRTRRDVIGTLIARDNPSTTTQVAGDLDLPSITVRRALEDLAAHKLVLRRKANKEEDGRADYWEITDRLAPLKKFVSTNSSTCVCLVNRDTPSTHTPPEGEGEIAETNFATNGDGPAPHSVLVAAEHERFEF